MIDWKDINRKLGDHEKRISDLEKLLTGKKPSELRKKNAKKTPTSTSAIRNLYHNEFFKTKKKFVDVVNSLSSKGMNFGKPQISKALDRADYLKKEGKSKRYTYIQKFPPT